MGDCLNIHLDGKSAKMTKITLEFKNTCDCGYGNTLIEAMEALHKDIDTYKKNFQNKRSMGMGFGEE